METTDAVRALAALAQPTRLAAFRLLVQQGPSGIAAGHIALALEIAPATLSFHLKELAAARLVRAQQAGRFVIYAADFAAMNDLLGFLGENCCAGDGTRCAPARPAARKAAVVARPRAAAHSVSTSPRVPKGVPR